MIKPLAVMLAFILCCALPAGAQDSAAATLSTGDPQLDSSLKALNDAAAKDLRDFAGRLARRYGVPQETADWLLQEAGMSPADAYMAVKVSHVSEQPVERVAAEYEESNGKGWGAVAREMGIRPGSDAFKELKRDDSGMLAEAERQRQEAGRDKGRGNGKDRGGRPDRGQKGKK